ncbi:nuclear transport factor 2 family protein [Pedobacter sp. UYP1]|uniref:nuclear transport factor 2 family protein n=1 Tax=Pedobacter sp. UYP1 TaxID=1756396 RepID=UPI003392C28B
MNESQMLNNQTLIKKAYAAFNNRNIDAVQSVMHSDIHWPKAFEGGYVIGHEAVKEYWTRQWSEINPIVEPVAFTERPDGKLEVKVYQLVKDLDGKILFDAKVKHIYVINDDLLQHMDIELS